MNATVEDVRFYESGAPPPEQEDRKYNGFFKSDEARYIFWEVLLTYPERYSGTKLVVHAQWFENGKRVWRHDSEHSHPSSWTGSYHTDGWGIKTSGPWDAGSYEVDFYVEGDFIAMGSFEVYD
tara:strand:- start:566 stop:934 length:369 start_codon:yes stop_codon:yes gene_type:complete